MASTARSCDTCGTGRRDESGSILVTAAKRPDIAVPHTGQPTRDFAL